MTPHEAWLSRRRAGIGGSDVAAIIGISPFKTALDVWAEKRGITTSASSPQMDFGRLLEPAILQAFSERSELQVRQVPQEFLPVAHRSRPWQLASPDGGTVTNPSCPVEAKNVSQWQSREWGVGVGVGVANNEMRPARASRAVREGRNLGPDGRRPDELKRKHGAG